MKLKRKLFSSILLVTLIPGIIGTALSLWVAKDILIRNTGEVLQTLAQCYIEDLNAHFAAGTVSPDGTTVASFLAKDLGIHHSAGDHTYHIDLVQGDGTVLFDCLGDKNDAYSPEEMQTLKGSSRGWFIIYKHGQELISGFRKVTFPPDAAGKATDNDLYIVVGLHQMNLTDKLRGFFIKVALPSMLVILLIAASWYQVTRRQLVKPLEALNEGVESVKKGRMDHEVKVKTGDEIEVLAEEFNAMVRNLKDYQDRLQAVVVRDEKRASIGTLAAGIAHELNNPLTAVIGFTESIQRRAAGDNFDKETVLRSIQKIQDSGWRCVKIIEALKSYAREATSDRSEENINDLVKAAILLVAHQFQSWSTIEIVQDLDDNIPPVLCDRSRIQQIIINLFVNARDVMPSGGTITVRTRTGDEAALGGKRHVVIEVEDTGMGIPPEALNRIFDPFFTTKPVGEGTGLGLSICQGIVANHDGTITASNKPDGTGALFTIRLPLSHQQAKVAYAGTDKFGDGIGPRV